ncbi:hypothetical protein [Nonomuraea sp. 10N515B]|uniref:hypothetical protein n=1 Tax=Nonomuraea sp. 10N515B TaxID=3457422 RepID=UPI003FCE4689
MRPDWAKLTDASGSAANIPHAIQALAADRAEDRALARENLWSRLGAQGSRYQATPYAIPFLIDALKRVGSDERVKLLEMIAFFAIGDDQDYLFSEFIPEDLRTEVARKLRMDSSQLHAELEDWVDDAASEREKFGRQFTSEWTGGEALLEDQWIALQCYDAVGDRIGDIIDLLSVSTPGERKWLLTILGYYPEKASISKSAVLELVEGEDDAEVLATAFITLGLIGASRDGECEAILRAYLGSSVPLVQWGAAIGLGWKAERELALARILAKCVEALEETPTGVPYNMGRIDLLADAILESWQ